MNQSEGLIFDQPDTYEVSFRKILDILIESLQSGGFFCSVLRSVSRSVSRSVLRSVLGSVLKSVIDLKNGLTIIYSHALRKSKLFLKLIFFGSVAKF